MERRIATLGLSALVFSCGLHPSGPPAANYTLQQRTLWSLAPASAHFGIVLSHPEHTLARLGALRKVGESGPIGRKYLAQALEASQKELGFDVLDAQAWRAQGIDPAQPMGLFLVGGDQVLIVLAPTDAARATALLERELTSAGKTQARCAPSGKWLVCSDQADLTAAPNEAASLWPRISKEQSPPELSSEIAVALRLDQGPLKKELQDEKGTDAASDYMRQSRGVFVGLSLPEDRIIVRGRYANPDSARLVKYARPEPHAKTLLGVGTGATTVARMYVSARELWKLAQESADKKTIDQASGGFMLATGLDLEKDVIQNLTGEMIGVGYGQRGEQSRVSGAWLIGTQDDARTRRVAERLDALAAGGLATVQTALEATGWKIHHSTDTVAGRPCYTYSVDVPPDQMKQMGMNHINVHLSTMPGALVLAFDRPSLDRVMAAAGKPASAFLEELGTAEAQEAFQSTAPFVVWGLQSSFTGGGKQQLDAMSSDFATLHPDVAGALLEYVSLAELIYDSTTQVEIKGDGISFFHQFTLM